MSQEKELTTVIKPSTIMNPPIPTIPTNEMISNICQISSGFLHLHLPGFLLTVLVLPLREGSVLLLSYSAFDSSFLPFTSSKFVIERLNMIFGVVSRTFTPTIFYLS